MADIRPLVEFLSVFLDVVNGSSSAFASPTRLLRVSIGCFVNAYWSRVSDLFFSRLSSCYQWLLFAKFIFCL
jgi:hypothetical protein